MEQSLFLDSFDELLIALRLRRDLEPPFLILIQVRSNIERRFHRYWIKGLTPGCTGEL